MVFGRAVDEDLLRFESFRQRREEFKFAHHFDAAPFPPPPLQERTNRLGLARKPVPHGQRFVEALQLGERLADRLNGEEVKGSSRSSRRLGHEPLPEGGDFGRVAELKTDRRFGWA